MILLILCAFVLIAKSGSNNEGLGIHDGWEGKLPIVMPKTLKAKYEGQSHSCDEWCTLGLCCECQSSNFENKPARPKYKFPGPFDGKPGHSSGDDACRCDGAPDIDHTTCFNPFKDKGAAIANYDTYLKTCCTYSETFHDYEKEEQEKYQMHKRLTDAVALKEERYLPEGKHMDDLDPELQLPVHCHVLKAEGFKCFDRSVYNDVAMLSFERGRTVGATWNMFTTNCCQKPTCGNLRAANPSKYSCKMLDQKFRFKPEKSSDLRTTSSGWFLDCCTCSHDSCGTCDELSSKMQCTGQVPAFNVAMKGNPLTCLQDDFLRVCCVPSSASATGISYKHCWGDDPPDVSDRRLAASLDWSPPSRLTFMIISFFSLFMFLSLCKCYKVWTTQAGDEIELLLDQHHL